MRAIYVYACIVVLLISVKFNVFEKIGSQTCVRILLNSIDNM